VRRTPAAPSTPDPTVDEEVHQHHSHPNGDPPRVPDPLRIDDGDQVVLDEPSGVSGLPSEAAEMVLDGGKGAGPCEEGDEGAPESSGNVDPNDPPLPRHQEATEDHKQDEPEMHHQGDVGEDAIDHGTRLQKRWGAFRVGAMRDKQHEASPIPIAGAPAGM